MAYKWPQLNKKKALVLRVLLTTIEYIVIIFPFSPLIYRLPWKHL